MTIKSDRVAELIFEHLSDILLTSVRDPRISGITVTHVRVDREIEHAHIKVNALGEEDRYEEVMEGLDRATGYLRSELASRLRLRRMPQLHFEWDFTLAHADHMEQLLDSLEYTTDNTDTNEEAGIDLDE